MLARSALILITVFWVTMNFLLWRSEFGQRNAVGSAVPLAAVWQKVLTAPDNSSLDIFYHGKKIGFCRWAASVGEAAAGKLASEDVPPEGMVAQPTGYRIDFDGNATTDNFTTRLRFEFNMRFATNHAWQELNLRLNMRPDVWEFHSVAAEQNVRMTIEDETGKSDRVFKFSELQNPQTLLREFGAPFPLALFGATGLPAAGPQNLSLPMLGLKWEARNDWYRIGHSPVRVYRLQARMLERYQIVVIISRVGEILRVELPDEVVLTNDQLMNL